MQQFISFKAPPPPTPDADDVERAADSARTQTQLLTAMLDELTRIRMHLEQVTGETISEEDKDTGDLR